MSFFVLAIVVAASPTELTVPETLRTITAPLELSGLTWMPSIDRYIAVSDDTGFPDSKSKATPWLFTISREGVIDQRPLLISGIDRVDDLESITRRGETLYAITSHSLTTKGKSKPERRQLLRIEKMAVVWSIDVLTLGLEGPVDIEAIAVRDESSLIIGLKAPLDANGRAQLFVFDEKKRTLSSWATVSLVAPNGVHEGVTDLLVLPNGVMVLAANAPKSGPGDEGGALWKLSAPGAKPELLHRFPGLKPEGLSLTPDGKRIVVLFDRGALTPQWLEVPLP